MSEQMREALMFGQDLEATLRKSKCFSRVYIPTQHSTSEDIVKVELARNLTRLLADKITYAVIDKDYQKEMKEVEGQVWIMNKFDIYELLLSAWKMGINGENIERFNPSHQPTHISASRLWNKKSAPPD